MADPSPTQPFSAEEEAAIRKLCEPREPSPGEQFEKFQVWAHVSMQRMLATLDAARAAAHAEQLANHAERDEWSRVAALLDLAPYGGAYDAKEILPAIRALVTHYP